MTDFAAIDFETANEQPCSVCSVGVVIVRGGKIVDSFYSLINGLPATQELADAEACARIAMEIL